MKIQITLDLSDKILEKLNRLEGKPGKMDRAGVKKLVPQMVLDVANGFLSQGLADSEDHQRIGQALTSELMLRPDRDHDGRYLTTEGNKTPIGISRTVFRIIKDNRLKPCQPPSHPSP